MNLHWRENGSDVEEALDGASSFWISFFVCAVVVMGSVGVVPPFFSFFPAEREEVVGSGGVTARPTSTRSKTGSPKWRR